MKVITAPEYYVRKKDEIEVFLGGGITNCENWQEKVIKYLKSLPAKDTEHLVIYNPRRSSWPDESDIEEIRRQINWEHDYIQKSDIFSMYFTNTKKSDQPICFYELGRYATRPGYDIISYQKGFTRSVDVEMQMSINYQGAFKINKEITPEEHAQIIFERYKREEKYIRCCENDACDEEDRNCYTSYRPRRPRR